MNLLPRYPIYVPSKGRWERCHTALFLLSDGVPFKLVVEAEEHDEYAKRYGAENLLVLPFSNAGSVIPARNWIIEHAIEQGAARHWQLDDNIRRVVRRWRGRRVVCDSGPALRCVEDFSDRYENVAIAGLNYRTFATDGNPYPPFTLNQHVYSASLVLNSLPQRWRGRYNEDTDICLQVLADGWCTVLVNVFLIDKLATMQQKGGNTDTLYHGDGRLKMARSLERMWPGVVTTRRRFNRPQHVIKDAWRSFDTPLRLRDDVDLAQLPPIDDYGLSVRELQPVQSERLRRLIAQPPAAS